MLSLTTKWLPKTTPQPANHGLRTPTNTTTATPRAQPTPINRTQATTNQQTTTNKQTIQQLRPPHLPRRGRPILIKRIQQSPQQSQHLDQLQRAISSRNYEILNQESYAQLLNQSQNQATLNQNLNCNPCMTTQLNPNRARTEFLRNQANQNQLNCTTTQLNPSRARTEFLRNQANQNQLNCTTTQLNLNRARTEFLRKKNPNQLNYITTQLNPSRARTEFLTQQRAKQIIQANQLRELLQIQKKQNCQVTTAESIGSESPIYQIIRVPFLARSFVPQPLMKQRKSITNGLVKLKQIILNGNEKNGQKIIYCPEKKQENISAHLNLLNQQQQNNTLNTETTATPLTNNVQNQSETAIASNLDLSSEKITTTTTQSAEMMGIQLPGDDYQDLNGALQIAAVEELMAPACLDDYFIEANTISDFDIIKGTYKLQELNEMTINQMNVNYAGQQLQLLPENGHEEHQQQQQQQEQILKDIPSDNDNIYNILRMPYSEELVTLTQPLQHETTSLTESESLFTQYIDINADSSDNNSSSSYIEVSPGSPLPTESDCIATSDLHTFKDIDINNCHNNTSVVDDELAYGLEFSPPQSIEPVSTSELPSQNSPVCQSNSSADEEALDLEQILKQLEQASQVELQQYHQIQQQQQPTQQQQQQQQNTTTITNLKRNSDHFGEQPTTITKFAKKSRMHIPMARLVTDARCENFLTAAAATIKVPDTPEVCDMVDEWLTEDIDVSIHSLSSSPAWSGTSFAAPDFTTDSFTLIEPKYENPPSIASSYICEEALYATPSPSHSSSSSTLYSTNPSSPAVSHYGNGNGSSSNGFKRKPRGRPPKQHSDMPDPELLRSLPDSERKRIEDRCKNNEASRQSRQKNKEKQIILQAEEQQEEQRNAELKDRLKQLEKQHLRLKNILYRKLGNAN